MKFFLKNLDKNNLHKNTNSITKLHFFLYKNYLTSYKFYKNNFAKSFLKTGNLIKNKVQFANLIQNFNYFFLFRSKFIKKNYPNLNWVIQDFLEKKLNFNYIFNIIINLIKPPFLVKSITIPKKLRKKTKTKYLVKIVYKNENKRLKNSYKQLYYYSNKFSDGQFNVRLYKSLMFSFLDWKESHLFKLKSTVFKKFFKF